MATRETLKEDGGKSASSCPRPIPMAAVKTAAAIVASKTSAAPMSSAPSLPNLPAPVSISTSISSGRQLFGLSQSHPEKQQQHVVVKQPHELLPPLSTGATRTFLSLQSKIPVASMQQIPAIPKMKQKNNTITNNFDNQDTIHRRSGKWTIEEELYANILIQLFEEGRVDKFEHTNDGDSNNDNSEEEMQAPTFKITNGMTLRAYLSRKLFCSPMRISKKFAGKGIGKLVYTSQSPSTYHQRQRQERFPFSLGPITSNNTHAHFLPSDSQWNKLKQAESKFLGVAFPYGGGPMKVNKINSRPTPMKATASFAAPPYASKRSLSSQLEFKGISSTKGSRPNKVPRVGTSSRGPLQMQAPLTANGTASSSNQPNLGDTTNSTSPELLQEYKYPYLSCLDQQQLVQQQQQNEQRREQHCSATGESPPASATTRDAPFSCHSLSQNARNPNYPPLAPFQNNTLQLQHQKQPCNANIRIMGSQHHSKATGDIYSNHNATAFPNYNNTASPSAITSSPNSNESSLSQKQSSPLRAAPRLLSLNSKLQQMQGQQKSQRVQERNQSQIQVLEEAYLNSVSSNKSQVSKNDKINNNSMLAACPKLPAQLVHNAQPSTKIEGFDWNQMMGVSTKPAIDLPNFLMGFDKVSKHKPGSPFDQSAPNNSTECDLQHSAALFSPAYHTSKSFDDFHRHLGKGLSPTVSPPPQFPNLRTTNAGPAVPSIESSDVASMSNLQMRPRKQQNMASAKINSDTTSSKSSAANLEKRSDESLLIEAYAEAIKSSHGCQQALQTTKPQGKTDVNSSDRYNIFARKQPTMALSQKSAYALQEKDQERPYPCCDQTQQHKPDEPLFDFPLEGMMFEDFETLASSPGTSDRCGTVSDPSDGSEGPITGVGGGGMSDDSDYTKLEESSKGKRKKLRSTSGQSTWTWGRSSFKF